MPKRTKEVKKIVVDYKAVQEDLNKPLCFGEKCSYCRIDLCGKDWFEKCSEGSH